MTHLEKLQTRYEELSTLLDAIDAARSKVYDQKKMDLTKVLEKYFTAEEGDIVDCSYSSVNIRRKGADSYNSFLTIYVDHRWNEDDKRTYTKLYISNSSFRTDEISEWIVNTFASQTYYTRIAVDFQDAILAEMNKVTDAAVSKMKEIAAPAKELREEQREIFEEIQSIKKEARLKALNSEEGLTIEGIEKERWGDTYIEYPDLEVKFDWTIRSIRGLKIDRITPSGKSADITVKVKRDRWNDNGTVIRDVIEDLKVKRVRMDKIESFMRYNNIAI